MQNDVEISCNIYSKRKKIFAELLQDFREKNRLETLVITYRVIKKASSVYTWKTRCLFVIFFCNSDSRV